MSSPTELNPMKFFVDTADIAEITELNDTGLLDGVTTNPSLVAKTGKDFVATVKEICRVVKGPVSAEVTATEDRKEHTSELQSLMRISYAVFCLNKKKRTRKRL